MIVIIITLLIVLNDDGKPISNERHHLIMFVSKRSVSIAINIDITPYQY
jgi:hypothetical protein